MEGHGDGKPVIDVTNVIGPDGGMALGLTTSGAEEHQKMIPEAKVVKAFNYVFAKHMSEGRVRGEQLTAFIAGNDAEAREKVLRLASEIGFSPINAGGLEVARYLESMEIMLMNLAFGLGMGRDFGYFLIK